MSSINRVILVGNVGKEVEIRLLQAGGDEVANFSLATSETWKDKNGEKQTKTEWHKIVVFNKSLVNLVKEYVNKGSKLYIEGKIKTRKWVDSNATDKYTTEIILDNFNSKIVLLGGEGGKEDKKEPSSSYSEYKQHGRAKEQPEGEAPEFDDEVPF